jgi:hypothetical protein
MAFLRALLGAFSHATQILLGQSLPASRPLVLLKVAKPEALGWHCPPHPSRDGLTRH